MHVACISHASRIHLVLAGDCYFIGCTDSTRANYDPTANQDSGLCTPIFRGCTDSNALNFGPDFNTEDGSCVVGGCLDPNDSNYNSLATYNDASCAITAGRRRKLAVNEGSGCMAPSVRAAAYRVIVNLAPRSTLVARSNK